MALEWLRSQHVWRHAEKELLQGGSVEGIVAFPSYHRTPEQILETSESLKVCVAAQIVDDVSVEGDDTY